MILTINDTFTESFQLSEEKHQNFILLSNDKNPLHTSDEFALSKGFKEKVMHGNILNAFISYFVGECLPTKGVIIHSQEIQFKNPVYLNDKLTFNAEVIGIFESVNVVEFKYIFINSDAVKVAKGKITIGLI